MTMKRNKRVKKELTEQQLKLRRKACLAQAFYMRADAIKTSVTANDDGTHTAFAEALPSTGHPNVLGAYTGPREWAYKYLMNITQAAEALGLTVELEVVS